MKIVYSYFNELTGESIVTLADRYGKYTGKAKCHPKDKDHASRFMGCRLAEKRAYIKLLKNRLRHNKIRLVTTQNILKEIINQQNTNKYQTIILKLNLQIKHYNKEIKNTKDLIQKINESMKTNIEMREKIINKIKK